MSVMTSPGHTSLVRSRPAPEQTPASRRGLGSLDLSARAPLAAAGGIIIGAGMLTGLPALLLLGSTLSAASLLARRLPVDLSVLLGALLLLLAATAVGTAAAFVDASMLVGPATLALATGLAVVAGILARRTASSGIAKAGVPWWASVPALVAVAVGLAQSAFPELAAPWALLGTDVAEHMVILNGVQSAGHLDYSATLYPRGLHALLAGVAAPWSPTASSVAMLEHDLSLYSTAIWFSLALMLLALAAATARTCVALGLNQTTARTTALAVGTATLCSGSAQIALVHMGAAPVMLAVAVLWLLCLLPAAGWRQDRTVLLLSSAAALLLAHLWQPLVAAPALVLAVLLIGRWRGGDRLRQPRLTLSAAGVLASAAASAALALPPLIAVQAAGGVGIAAIPGEIPGPPLALVLLTPVAALLAWHCRDRWGPFPAAVCCGLVSAVAVLLAGAGGGWDLAQYYPRKALWVLALFCLPLVGALLASTLPHLVEVLWRLTGTFASLRTVARAGLVACCVTAALGATLPGVVKPDSLLRTALAGGGPDAPGTRRLQLAQELLQQYPGRTVVPSGAALTYVAHTPGSYVLSKLLRLQTGQATNFGNPEDVCQDVRRVAGPGPAVVVSDLEPAVMRRVMLRGGCGSADVRQLDGGFEHVIEAVGRDLS